MAGARPITQKKLDAQRDDAEKWHVLIVRFGPDLWPRMHELHQRGVVLSALIRKSVAAYLDDDRVVREADDVARRVRQ